MLYSFLKPSVSPDSALSSEQPIPRKIWQTCKDKKSIHPQLSQCISSLKGMNPNWAYTLFDDESQHEFIKAVCSERFLRAYERIQPLHGAARADIFRYLVVFLHGGAYFDLKSGTTRPLDEILILTIHLLSPNGTTALMAGSLGLELSANFKTSRAVNMSSGSSSLLRGILF